MRENMWPTEPVRLKEESVPPKEDGILRKQENIIALARRLENVYAKRPDMEDFEGAMSGTKFADEYSKENISRDLSYVDDTRDKIDAVNSSRGQDALDHFEENFAFAEAAQAMIVDRLNNWLPDFKSVMTSDYDDLRVGIDMVTKHKDGGYFGTAYDATVSSNPDKITDKLTKNWKYNVSKGALPVVKYFEDPDTGEKGRVLVPKFIIGASAVDVNDMAKAYLAGTEDSLDSHPFRKLMLEQIEIQLNDALYYFEDNQDDPRFNLARREYTRVKEMIKGALQQLNDAKLIDPLDYHEYSKNSLALNLIKEFSEKKE
jgi:hypothetical protein